VSSGATVAVAVLIPLAGAGLIVLASRRPNLREAVTLVTASALFLVVASLLPGVLAGGRPEIVIAPLLPAAPLAFRIEPLGMLYALVASFLWLVTSIYSIGYMRGHAEENQTRFYAFFAVSLAATMGIAFAANLLTLFLFYEALTLATFPLVTHAGTDEARRAGRVYLGILVGTSIGLFLLAILWSWSAAGTLDFVKGGFLKGKVSPAVGSALLVLYVLGIGKAAVMPFHRWLPAAMVAPTPVSALLHAVAVVKAGVFTVLKVVVYVFGTDYLGSLASAEFLRWLAAATILIASLVAMTRDNLKARLAYSTVSQLSYIVLGAMLADRLGILGGGMHIATHAFGKITLFFCAGAILVASHKTEVSQLDGIGRTMPFTTFAFLLGSLSIIGLPPFGGLWSKWYLALGALDANEIALVAVLMVSSLLNIAYLLPIPLRGFFADPAPDDHDAHHHAPQRRFGPRLKGVREAPWPCLIALAVTSAGTVVLFFAPDALTRLLAPIAAP
jgi:multicomponent Na+:H+ antiporter subunit D